MLEQHISPEPFAQPNHDMSPLRMAMIQLLLVPVGMGLSAFSRASIRKMRIRDHHECVVGSGCCGPLQAAHLNHDQSDPAYNDPANGITLCMHHHLQDHEEREGSNGLSPEDNFKAINSLRHQLARYE